MEEGENKTANASPKKLLYRKLYYYRKRESFLRKRLLVVLLVAVFMMSVGAPMAMADAEDFDEFFEQSAFFPTDFASRVYENGGLQFMNGPVERKDGVLYVSSVMLGNLLHETYRLVSYGTDDGEPVRFILAEPGQDSWGYTENDPIAFGAWVGQTRCLVGNEEKTLHYAPYRLTLDNGTPYVMLPLREVCRVLDWACIYTDGLIILTKQAPDEAWLLAQQDKLALIKEQLSQPFVGENGYYLQMANGQVLIGGPDKEPMDAVSKKSTIICRAQDSHGQVVSQWNDTEEMTTQIVLHDTSSGESQRIAILPNKKLGYGEGEKERYRFYTNPRYSLVPGGYMIEVLYFGGNAQSSLDYLFYATADGQVIRLNDEALGNYVVTDEALYYNLGYSGAPIGVQRGLLYRYNWGDAAPSPIGQADFHYRQIAYLGEGQLVVAASPVETPEDVRLYRLDTTSGEQQLLTETRVDRLPMTDAAGYFQINGAEIWYQGADGQTLYKQSLMDNNSQAVNDAQDKSAMQPVADGFCFIGTNHHLYWSAVEAKISLDLSRRAIGCYVSDGQRVFYNTIGYEAGVYQWENGQTIKLLSQQVEDLKLDSQGALVILPKDACDYYYVYDQGKVRTVKISA